jgi:Leucine-rich repeat (LRR) protein
VVECDSFSDYSDFKYTCNVGRKNNSNNDNSLITAVKTKHANGKTDDDVKGIYSPHGKINFIPKDLTKFFKNIEYIWIGGTDIKIIRKDDLKEFWPNLKILVLSSNKIKHIETGAFDGMENLVRLELNNNPCTSNQDVARNRSKVLDLIRNVEVKCKSLEISTTTKTPKVSSTTTVNPMKTEISLLKLNLSTTLEILKSKNEEIKKLKDEITNIQSNAAELKHENQNCTKVDEDFKKFHKI